MKEYLLVRTYTITDAPGCGEDTVCGRDVYCYSYDPTMGQIGDVIDMLEMENPSYLMTDKSGNLLFAVNETGNTGMVVLCSQKEGKLEVVDRLSSGGAAAYHTAYKGDRGLPAIANYMGDGMSIVTVWDRRKLEHRLHIWCQGEGNIEVRQEVSHVHSYLFYEDYLLVAGLGLDKIHLYRMVDGETEFLKDVDTRVGNGPRYMAVYREGDGIWLYVINELSCSVSIYRFRMEEFQEIQREPLCDGPFVEGSLTADIRITKNGILYTSLHGADQIV